MAFETIYHVYELMKLNLKVNMLFVYLVLLLILRELCY
jgi:hypothetical protein